MRQQVLLTAAAALSLILGSLMAAMAQTDNAPNPAMQQPSTAPTAGRAARAGRGRAARGATRPSTSSARRGAATAAAASRPAILPDEFAILNTQNPFARLGSAGSDGRGAGGRGGAAGAGGPEAGILFSGSILVDSNFTAFLEDSTSKKTMKLNVGDSVARGRITSIDLDSLTYETDGNSQRVMVGQNLLGQTPPPPATQPANSPQPGAGQPGAPAAARRGAAARGRGAANAPNPVPQGVPQDGTN